LDEADVLGRPEGHFMLSIFLSGYEVEATLPICAKGEDDVIDYPVFGPKLCDNSLDQQPRASQSLHRHSK